MTEWVDLHLHSSCSDGTETPEELVVRAAGIGASAMALTDHDTVKGVCAAQQAAESAGLAFLTGVEISCCFDEREMHIVGLGIDTNAPELKALLKTLAEMRRNRMDAIIKRLNNRGVTFEQPDRQNGSVGRMHVAVALHEMGKASSVQNAFDKYLNRGCPAYVPKQLPSAAQAVDTIHAAKGLAFIAHPGLGPWIMKQLPNLLKLPFDGLEAWHPSHNTFLTNDIIDLAQTRSLLLSGGSDCHGNIKGDGITLGRIKTPLSCFKHIMDALSAAHSR